MTATLNFLAPETQEGRLPFGLQTKVPEPHYAAIQTWVLAFLTDQGSRKADPQYGTMFGLMLQSGSLLLESDVRREFDIANRSALKYCVSDSGIWVTNVVLTKIRVDTSLTGKFIVLYVHFFFSDGTQTRTFIEV